MIAMRRFVEIFGLLFLAAMALVAFYRISTSQFISRTISPDGRTELVVEEMEYGNSFGPTYYFVRIEPNSLLKILSNKKLLEIPSFASTAAPVVTWVNPNLVMVTLDMKGERLPPDDAYERIRIRYKLIGTGDRIRN